MEHIKNGVEFSDMDDETKDKLIREMCFDPCDPCKEDVICDDCDHYKNRFKGYDFIEIEFECDNCTHSWKESFYDMIDEYLTPSERKKVYEYLKKEYEK